jgi:hypothetical protein
MDRGYYFARLLACVRLLLTYPTVDRFRPVRFTPVLVSVAMLLEVWMFKHSRLKFWELEGEENANLIRPIVPSKRANTDYPV